MYYLKYISLRQTAINFSMSEFRAESKKQYFTSTFVFMIFHEKAWLTLNIENTPKKANHSK